MKNVYVADFETEGAKYYEKYGHTKIWLYSIKNIDGTVTNNGVTLDEFFNFIKRQNKELTQKTNVFNIYFHNAKFDTSFIMSYLANKGYTTTKNILGSKQIKYMVSSMNIFFKMSFKLNAKITINILDSLNLLQAAVADLPYSSKEELSIDFDYTSIRNYTTLDNVKPHELKYCNGDVETVRLNLIEYFEKIGTKITTPANAFSKWSSGIDKPAPILRKKDLNILRKGYMGGFTHLNPIYLNKTLNNVSSWDVNSLYPYVMYSKKLPYSQTTRIPYKDYQKYKSSNVKYDLFIYEIHIHRAKLKEGYHPFLSISGNKGTTRSLNTNFLTSVIAQNHILT